MQRLTLRVGPDETLLGRLGAVVGTQLAAITQAREAVGKYEGPLKTEFVTAMRNLLDGAMTVSVQGLVATYGKELDAVSSPAAPFPLGRAAPMGIEPFRAALKALERVKADSVDAAVPAEVKKALETQFGRAERALAFASALVGLDGEPLQARVVLIRDRDQVATIERVAGVASATRIPLARVYPSFRLGGRDLRARGLVDNLEIGRFAVPATPPPLQFSTTPDPKPEPDATIAFEDGWSLLRLLLQGSVRRQDGLEWDTVVRLREERTELALAVTIVFEKALPTLDRWPASAK
jgi:hypothetical protein